MSVGQKIQTKTSLILSKYLQDETISYDIFIWNFFTNNKVSATNSVKNLPQIYLRLKKFFSLYGNSVPNIFSHLLKKFSVLFQNSLALFKDQISTILKQEPDITLLNRVTQG